MEGISRQGNYPHKFFCYFKCFISVFKSRAPAMKKYVWVGKVMEKRNEILLVVMFTIILGLTVNFTIL